MPAVPKDPILNASIKFDGTDLSNTANEVQLKDSAEEKDVTTFQGGEYSESRAGMKKVDGLIKVFQDYTAGSVHSTCAPLYRDKTRFQIVIQADNGPVAVDNPAWILVGQLYEYQPIGAKAGDPQEFSIPFKNSSKYGLKEATSQAELEAFEAEMAVV